MKNLVLLLQENKKNCGNAINEIQQSFKAFSLVNNFLISFGIKKLILFSFLILFSLLLKASPSWMGNQTYVQDGSTQNITFTVWQNQDYVGLHCNVGLSTDGGSTYNEYAMTYSGNNSGNSVWTLTMSVHSSTNATNTKCYFKGYDDWSWSMLLNNGGANYTFIVNPTTKSGATNWNVSGSWIDNAVPTWTSATYVIANNLTLNQDVIVGSITINSGITLTGADGSARKLTVGSNFNNNGTFTATTNNTVWFSGAGSVGGSSTTTFNNLTINSGALTLSPAPTINGTFQINGGNVTAAPNYANTSTLIYNVVYNPYLEWTSGAPSGAGVPQNVVIGNGVNSAVAFGASYNNYYQLLGNLTISSGSSLTLHATNTNNALKFGGSFTNNGTFTTSGRGLFFTGSTNQVLSSVTNPQTLDYLILVPTGSATLQLSTSNFSLNSNSGALNFTNAGGLDLNQKTLTFTSGATISMSANGTISSSGGTGTIACPGAITLNSGGTLTTNGSVTMNLAGQLSNSGALTVQGSLQLNSGGSVITNAPTYASTSTLIYNTGNTKTVGTEWTAGATSGAGYPGNVQIGNGAANSTLTLGNSNYSLAGNIIFSNNTGSNLTLGSGTLNVGGSWINNSPNVASSFTSGTSTVVFNGTGTPTIGGNNSNLNGYSFYNITINKTSGSVTITNTIASTNSAINLQSNLILGAANIIAGTTILNFNGGTLTTGATTGYPLTLTSVPTVTLNSTLSLGTGNHIIAFGKTTTTFANTLTIKNWTGTLGTSGTGSPNGQIVFGNDNTGLSSGSLAKVSFNGYSGTTVITNLGEIVPPASPTISDFSCSPGSGHSGYVGCSVTITGLNLNLVTAGNVKVNGVSVGAFTYGSGTITYTAPSGSGVVSVSDGTNVSNGPSYTDQGYITNSAADFNTAGTWLGSGLPPASSTVTINNNGVTISGSSFSPTTVNILANAKLDINNASGALTASTISNSGTLTFSAAGAVTAGTVTNAGTILFPATGTLNITSGGTLSNTGTFSSGSGIVAFAAAGIISGSSSIFFNQLTIGSGLVTLTTIPTINGTLQMNNSSGNVSIAPNYGVSSTLIYNATTISTGNEWTYVGNLASIPSGAGIPQNVVVGNGTATSLSLATSNAYHVLGNFTVSSGSAVTLPGGSDGSLRFGGDFNNQGTLTPNGRGLFFEGTSNHTITSIANPQDLDYFLINPSNSAVMKLGSNFNVKNAGGLTFSTAGGIDLNQNTLSLTSTSGITLTANGTISSSTGTGTLALNTVFTSGSGTLTTSGSVKVTLGGTFTINTANTISVLGTLQINSGGSVASNPPFYGNASTLVYNLASPTLGAEWKSGATGASAGVPQNVLVGNGTNTALSFSALTGAYTLNGNFTVALNSSVILSSDASNNLQFGGDFNNLGTFNSNGRGLFFVGTADHTITSAANPQLLDYFILNSANNLKLGSNITVQGTASQALQFQNTGGLDLNQKTLTMNSNTTLLLNASGIKTIFSSGGTGTLSCSGTMLNPASGSLTTSGSVLVILGSPLTINGSGALTVQGTLQLNSGGSVSSYAPIYSGSTSYLIYNGGTKSVTSEWTGNGTSTGTGIPQNVTIQNSTSISMPGSDRGLAGNLNINGTLALNALGNLYVAGNWARTNSSTTFTHNNKTVFFNGGAAQTITISGGGTENFGNLTLNNTTGLSLGTSSSATVAGTLTLTQGIFNTTAGTLSVTNPVVTAISGGSNTPKTYVDGSLSWSLPNSGTGSNFTYPVGNNNTYLPFILSSPTGSSYAVVVTAYGTGATGTANGTTLLNISGTEWWKASFTGTSYSGGSVSLSRPTTIYPLNAVARSSASDGSGTYNSLGGTSGTTGVTNSTTTGSSLGSFALATLNGPIFTSVTSNSNYNSGTGLNDNNGYTGSTIQIIGTNLGGVTALTFGSTNAFSWITSNTGTEIDLTLGALSTAGSYTLSATATMGSTSKPNFVYLGYISTNITTDWNTGTTWLGGTVPPTAAGTVVTIANPVTVSGTATSPGTLNINSGNALTFNAGSALTVSSALTNTGSIIMSSGGTLTLSANGLLTNNGSFTGGAGTVAYIGAGVVNGSNAITFNNLTIGSGAVTLTTVPTINGTLQLNSGGSVSAAPNYGNSSTLFYNATTSSRSNEWTLNVTSNPGYPNNVNIGSSTQACALSLNNSNVIQMGGILTIGAASGSASSFTLNDNGTTPSPLTIVKDIVINATGTLTLGNINGANAGDIKIGGNWTNNGGTFTSNSRAVVFNGTSIQTITNSSGIENFIYFVDNNNGGNVQLNSSININTSSSTINVLQLLNSGTLDLNGHTLSFTGNNTTVGTILVSGGARSIISSTAGGILSINGPMTVANSAGGSISIAGSVALNQNAIVDFGSGLTTINGTLSINSNVNCYVLNNPPIYATNSVLKFNSGTAYGRGKEWNSTSGAGYPYNIQISNYTTCEMGDNGNTGIVGQCAGNLTIDNGSTFTMNNSGNVMTKELRVLGIVSNSGNLILSGNSLGDLYVGGNFTNGGTFTHNSRNVTFNGVGSQNINGATTFSGLIYNSGSTTGTLTLNTTIGASSMTLQNGTIQPTANNQINSSSTTLTLNGGTYNSGVASGYNETFGQMIVSSNSAIQLNTSNSYYLTFAASGSQTWSGSLAITGWKGNAGTAPGTAGKVMIPSVPAGQLNNIKFTDLSGTPIGIITGGELIPACSLSSTPTSPTSLTFGANNYATKADLNWTNGNGYGRIVVASTSTISTPPSDGTSYTGIAAFGIGTPCSGGYVVYNGTSSSVTVTNLNPGTQYYFAVYEYNFDGTNTCTTKFNTTAATNNKTTSGSYITINDNGFWNTGTDWLDGTVPPAGVSVTINNTNFTYNAVNNTVYNLTISNSKSLVSNNGAGLTLNIANGGSISNSGTFTTNDGTVSFLGTGAVSGNAITFNNVIINANQVTLNTVPTINGTLQINNGNLSTAPKYGASSTLLYNVTYGRFVEWNANGVQTIGVAGYPNNVIINTGTFDLFNSSSTDLALNGVLTVNNGATVNFNGMNKNFTEGNNVVINSGGTMNMNTMTNPAVINGNLTVAGTLNMNTMSNTATINGNLNVSGALNMNSMSSSITATGTVNISSGSLTMSSVGYGDLYTGGNWNNSGGTFAANGRSVFLNGSSGQTIKSNGQSFGYLIIRNGNSATLLDNTTITNGLTLQDNSTFALGGKTLTYVSGATLSYTGTGNVPTSATNEFPASAGTINLTVNKTSGGSVTLDGSKTLNGSVVVTSGTLIIGTNSLNAGSNPISDAGTITVGGTLTGGNISVNTLTASGTSTINCAGNWSVSNFTCGQSAVYFDGSGVQTVSNTQVFYDGILSGTGTLDYGSSSTINHLFKITNGSAIYSHTGGRPTYATNSTLEYATGSSYNIGYEWNVTGTGVPYNVNISTTNLLINNSNAYPISGNLTIGSGKELRTITTGSFTIPGTLTNNGTFTPATGTVTFNGTNQQITGTSTTNFNNFTLNSSGILSLNSSITANNINLNAGTLQPTANNLINSNSTTLTLNGGTYNSGAASGYSETFGPMIVSNSSAIKLNSSNVHSLSFASSGTQTWSGSLAITGWKGTQGVSSSAGRIMIAAVPSGQLNNIKFTDLSEPPIGTIINGNELIAQCTPASTPSAASGLIFSNVYATQVTLSWTGGAGNTGRIIVASSSSFTSSDIPSTSTGYNPSTTFRNGDQITTGKYVVYSNTGNTVTVTGLSPGTTYYFDVFEYNTIGGLSCTANYLTPGLTGNTTTSSSYITKNNNGNWNTATDWQDGIIPPSSADVIINNSNFIYDVAKIVHNLTINASKSLVSNNGAGLILTIATGGILTNNGTFTANDGNVAFTGTGTITGTSTTTFNDITINTGAVTLSTVLTINGTLQFNSSTGSISAYPNYTGTSTLIYNATTFNRGSEWQLNVTSGAGYPNNVIVGNGTPCALSLNNSNVLQMGGNLAISTGSSLTLNEATTPKALTVIGNVTNAGSLILSTNSPGDIYVGGNWTDNGTFTPNNRAVFFNGGTQTIAKTGGEIFDYIIINNSTGISLSNNITVNKGLSMKNGSVILNSSTLSYNSGGTLTYNGTVTNNNRTTGNEFPTGSGAPTNLLINTDPSSTITLSGSKSLTGTLTLQNGQLNVGSSSTVTIGNNGYIIQQNSSALASGNNAGTFNFAGALTVTGTIGFYDVILAGAGTIDFGSGSTINDLLRIANGSAIFLSGEGHRPYYAINSTLEYATGGSYTIGWEWKDNDVVLTDAGVPYNVSISNTNPLLTNSTTYQANGNLTIASGKELQNNATGSFGIAGNLTNNGTFTPIGGTVTFNGTGTQNINGSNTVGFYNLTINKLSGTLTLSQPSTVSNQLNMTSGVLTTSGTNILTVTNTTNSGITGGSITSYIDGPVTWNLPSGSTGTYTFPLGKGDNYYPMAVINPTSSSGAFTLTGEAFNTGCGGNPDYSSTYIISPTEYWSLASTGNFNGSTVNLARTALISTYNLVGRSTTLTGTYASVGGTIVGNSLSSTTASSGAQQYYAWAQSTPSIPYTVANGNWSSTATWASGHVPLSGESPYVFHNVTLDVNTATLKAITINSGHILTFNANTSLNVTIGGSIISPNSLINAGTIDMSASNTIINMGTNGAGAGSLFTNTGTLTAGAGAVSFNCNGTHTISGTVVFNNVTVGSSGQLDFGINSTVNGILTINQTGLIKNNAPTYGSSSTLYYAYGTSSQPGRNIEWSSGSGKGYPANVEIGAYTTVPYNLGSSASINGSISGNLTIDANGKLWMDYTGTGASDGSASLTVGKDIIINGDLSLGKLAPGDLYLGGNWTHSGTNNINFNGRAVFFEGSTDQLITKTGTGAQTEDFDGSGTNGYFIINKPSGNVKLNTNTNFSMSNKAVGDVIQINNAGGLDLNGQTFSYTGNGNNNVGLRVTGGLRNIISSVAGGVFTVTNNNLINPDLNVVSQSSGSLVFDQNVIIKLAGGMNFGNTTVQGTLEIDPWGYVPTNPPTYSNTSLLYYNKDFYTRAAEWTAGTTSTGPGYPNNVTVGSTTHGCVFSLNNAGSDLQLGGILTIGAPSGSLISSLTMDEPTNPTKLKALKDVIVNTKGSLTLGSLNGALAGDLYISGNFTQNGTFNPNVRAVFFNGSSSTQTISGTGGVTFDYLIINTSGGAIVQTNNDINVNKNLTLTSGVMKLGNNNLILSNTSSILGSPWSSSNMIITDGTGVLRLGLSADGTYTYPVGNTGVYSPAILTFTGGTYSSAHADVNVQPVKDPNYNIVPSTDYLKRYWTVTQSGISGFTCSTEFDYVTGDVQGSESLLYCGKYDPTPYFWTVMNKADAINHKLTPTVTSFSEITGASYADITNSTLYFTIANGAWNSSSTWVSGAIPPDGVDATIKNNVQVTANTNTALKTLTINSGASLTFNGNYTVGANEYLNNIGTIDMTNGGHITLNSSLSNPSTFENTGTFTGGIGWVDFTGAGNLTVIGTIPFSNVSLTGTGIGSGLLGFNFGGNSTVNGSLTINTYSYIANNSAPVYGNGSTLVINTGGTFALYENSTNNESAGWWRNISGNGSPQKGIPWNLSINNNTSVIWNSVNDGYLRYLNGSLIINNGASFTLGGSSGGNLIIRGDFTNNGTFNTNNRSLNFYGGSTQNFNTGNSSITTIDLIDLNNSNGLNLQSLNSNNLTINQQLLLSNGILKQKYNSVVNTITMNGVTTLTAYANGYLDDGSYKSGQTTGSITCFCSILFGGYCTINGILPFNNITTNEPVNFYDSPYVYGTFELDPGGYADINAPKYYTGSLLKYNTGPGYNKRTEWSTVSGEGNPYHVLITGNTELRLGFQSVNTALSCRGNLTIDPGSALFMDYNGCGITPDCDMRMQQPLTVFGDLTINNGGIMTLSTLPGGDLNLKGNFINNGSFWHKDRLTTFNGTSVQNISGSNPPLFGLLTIDNSAGVTMNCNVTIAGTIISSDNLTFNNGIITTNANTLYLGSTTGVTGAGIGKYIYGNECISIPNGSAPSKTFDIGDANYYTPGTITFIGTTTGSGSITAHTTSNDHTNIAGSGLDNTKSVNRYWTLVNNGVTGFTSYTGAFTFANQDKDAGSNTANFIIRKYNGSTWSTTGLISALTNTNSAGGMTSFSDFQIGEILPLTVSTNPNSSTVCEGTGTSFTSSSNSLAPQSIKWQRKTLSPGFVDIDGSLDGSIYTGYSSGTLTLTPSSTSLNGYSYQAVFTNINGSATSTAAVLTVSPLVTAGVSISANPAGPVTSGTSVTFTASPTNGGSSPAYQWKVNGNPVGSNSYVYITSSLSVGSNNVACEMTSNATCVTGSPTTSNTVTLTVNSGCTPVSILTQPIASLSICSGLSATFTVYVAGSSPFTYQWQRGGSNVIPSSTNSGSTSSTFFINPIGTADAGSYTCVVSNSCTSGTTSNASVLTVKAIPSITNGPTSQLNKCIGSPVTFSVTVNGYTPLSYQWYKPAVKIVGATCSSYTIPSVASGDISQYYCIVSNICSSTFSTAAVLTVNSINITKEPSSPIVPSGATVKFDVVATGSNLSYKWQESPPSGSFSYLTESVNYISVTSPDMYISSVTYQNNYQYRCVITSSTCNLSATSDTGTLTINNSLSSGLWLGTIGNNGTGAWSNPNNWVGGVPDASTNAVIPGSATNQPVVDINNAICYSLTIQAGASVTIPNGSFLTVNGDPLTPGGTIYIKSNASGTGALLTEGCSSIAAGFVEVERYTTGLGYHYITSPLSNATVNQLQNNTTPTPITLKNLDGSHYNPANPPTAANLPNLWKLDEPASHAGNDQDMAAWLAATTGETMHPTVGYALIVPYSGAILKFTGSASYLNCGDVPAHLTKTSTTNGFNFIGNPYPSPIDWEKVYSDYALSPISTTIYFFHPTSLYYGAWGTYIVGLGPSGAFPHSQFIPSMQGFYIYTASSTTVTLNNNHRTVESVAMGQGFYKKTSNTANPIIRLISGNPAIPELSDETVIYFTNGVSEKFNSKFDGFKLKNTDPNIPDIYTISDNTNISIKALPDLMDNIVIRLGFNARTEGKYSINAGNISNFPVGTGIILEDRLEGKFQDLNINPDYIFTCNTGEFTERFYLHINPASTNINNPKISDDISVYSFDNNIYIKANGTNAYNGNIFVYDMLGQEIMVKVLDNTTLNTLALKVPGAYLVKVITNNSVSTNKVIIN